MTDLEIARSTKIKDINEVIKKLNIEEYAVNYGQNKAKVDLRLLEKNSSQSKLILVTAINPTPMGEGKTTVSISISDALCALGKKSVLALREPSLGPVFGVKGGATGGGYAQIVPMEDINLHFTGDFHAITSANNLLSSMIDNHIYQGNELKIKEVIFKRCIDLNDRSLRRITIGDAPLTRQDGFDITAASEIMAILCLSKDIEDLKRRLGNILIGYDEEGREVTAKDLKAEGAMTALLKEAIKPNLVSTLEGNPALVHGGPFANIAHGCNSIIATKMAMKLGEYTVTEAGFGADLGAEKFLDIKCPIMQINPDVVVLVVTIRALKYHGGSSKEDMLKEDISTLEKGLVNMQKHYDNLTKEYGLNVIVAINKFGTDTNNEVDFLEAKLKERKINYAITTGYIDGSKGSLDLAQKICETSNQKNNFHPTYNPEDSIKTKIEKVAIKIYGASSVNYSEKALEEIQNLEAQYHNLPICIAKTQYSLSDDAKRLVLDEEYSINVQEVVLRKGAEFIVVLTGKIMTMPGLPKSPNAEKIDVVNNQIEGIF